MRFRFIWLSICLLLCWTMANAQAPANDNIQDPRNLTNVIGYCSADAEFSNVNATSSGYAKGTFWTTAGNDVWFKFTAINTDVNISVTGLSAGSASTLTNPTIAIYTYNNNVLIEQIGSMVSGNNLTTAYKGGLTIGDEYYIRVSAEQDAMGTFKMCVNNYNPPKKPGQDCSTAAILCSKDTFTEYNVSGTGNSNHEAAGTCLTVESNSAWYQFTAATSGTLTFTITPTAITDDIDWVLYDLGPNGDCSNVNSQNAIRCAAGSGVTCTPRYYITGMDMNSQDVSEQPGCVGIQDGMVKYVDMVQGHVYALLVDNFSNGNNGFTIAFGGTGEFVGPKATIESIVNDCPVGQNFTFYTNATDVTSLTWTFGNGANIATANTAGPHVISYNSSGFKTVTLSAKGTKDCNIIESKRFYVGPALPQQVITANKLNFCPNDTIRLSVPLIDEATYAWTGPNNFTATTAAIEIPITSLDQAGAYQVTVTFGCPIPPSTVNITIDPFPEAAFESNPLFTIAKFIEPTSIQFTNKSKAAVSYEWDFGDGQTSTATSPLHIFNKGKYTIKLTASSSNGCLNSISMGTLVVLSQGTLLVPNSFSPNGDGINDQFNINIAYLKKFNINIFNRYGVKLFTSYSVFDSWDGTFKGKQLPTGTYYYQLKGTDFNGQEVSYSGSVTVFR
ncbi:MAG: gliding motility-associated C-terminal domain-containing protein [Pedobacter sp.]|nr:gliding motility-associated C-terminal domain-containing protein [Pedobacter sp.]